MCTEEVINIKIGYWANNLVRARGLSLVLSVQETTRKTLQMTKDDNKGEIVLCVQADV